MSGSSRSSAQTTANQKRKRNHWVPQAYLRAFAADAKRQKIWRFGKNGGAPELKPIDKVAVKFYLYAPNGPNGRDYSFEERLSSLEQLFGSPIWEEACRGFINLNNKINRKAISLLAAVMYLRNPAQFELTQRMHQAFVDTFSAAPELPHEIEIGGVVRKIDLESWPSYRDATEDDIRRMWLEQVGSAVWFAELLMKMRWSIILAEEPTFITTDHPVAVMHQTLEFKGLSDSGTLIFFPLSPTRLLVMDHNHKEPSGQYYPLAANPGSMNMLLFREANEYLFSSRDPDRVCAEICADADEQELAWAATAGTA
jgi:hypothetical protein